MSSACVGMKVAIRVDASELIGGGHVMRCLSLANALAERGAAISFACVEISGSLSDRIRAEGHTLAMIAPSHDAVASADWDQHPLPEVLQRQQASAVVTALGARRFDWLFVDHYRLGAAFETSARRVAERCFVIDDLANRPHRCDLLLDQTFGRDAAAYLPLVPDDCEVLVGPGFAPLRPEFAAARPRALQRRTHAPARRLLITLGSTDVGGITKKILGMVIDAALPLEIDVVLGPDAESLGYAREAAKRSNHVHLHVGSERMAELMVEADVAIGAAGTTSWERCCLALPTVALVLASNQRLIAQKLDEAGAHIRVGSDSGTALLSALTGLVENSELRVAMAQRAARITDGLGSARLCDALVKHETLT